MGNIIKKLKNHGTRGLISDLKRESGTDLMAHRETLPVFETPDNYQLILCGRLNYINGYFDIFVSFKN